MIIDVSKYQGAIDWKSAAPHLEGAFIKATGEETAGPVPFKDARFLANWRLAKSEDVRVGAYHFMDGGRGSATGKAEAEFFLATVDAAGGFKPGDFRPVLDVEWPPKSGAEFQIEQLGEAVEYIRQRVGWPIIYTGRWYWDQIIDSSDFEELLPCPLWIASYTAVPPVAPKPWDSAALWQYTDKGKVPGIAGCVDCNRLLGPMEVLVLT